MGGKNNTRNDILEVADRLLIERGFSSFSYKHIAVELGMRNAAIHYHFPAKSDLGIALVQRHRQRFSTWSAARENEATTAIERIKAFIEVRMSARADAEPVLAPESIVSADYEILPEGMQQEARALMQDMINWLSDTLSLGQEQGEFELSAPHEDLALMFAAAMHGAPQMAQANSGYNAPRMVTTLLELIGVKAEYQGLHSAGGTAA